jgi:hypothetical protein
MVCRTIEEESPNGCCCYLAKPIFLDEVLLILSESQCGIRLLAVGWHAGWHQWRSGGRYVTVVTVQNNTLGLGCAMGKWNCYAVTVTQGVSNPNDRFGVNGTVAL